MQDTELLKYGKYLTSLISSVILNTQPPEPFEGIDWTKLFKLAKKHDTATIVYDAIENMELPKDARTLFVNNKNRIVARTTRQAIEADKIFREFEKNNIRYIRLKGIHIKDFYPAPYMRVFGDVDVYVSKEDREKAKDLMKVLGYELDCAIDYHDEYKKDDFYIYEIHSPIVSENSFHHDVFSDPFNKAIAISENNLNYVLNNEYFYLHLFFHLYGHFIHNGCGIRLFTDLLVFQQSIKDTNYEFIKSVLKQYDLLDFYNTVQKLIDYFFFNGTANKNTLAIAEFIFKCRPNETSENRLANFSFWGKIKYLLKIWFPPAKELAFRYPVLEKAPVLLPVCWVRRIFYSLFFNRSAFTTQVNNVKKFNSEEFKEIKNARDLATKNK
ncbi:MAG: nucleotidyltransferase family protein [Ruminococcus sp.]|nr:nucleotidyltransferase family protein [Ruminococcus sp.]